jgi:hypothetical protein
MSEGGEGEKPGIARRDFLNLTAAVGGALLASGGSNLKDVQAAAKFIAGQEPGGAKPTSSELQSAPETRTSLEPIYFSILKDPKIKEPESARGWREEGVDYYTVGINGESGEFRRELEEALEDEGFNLLVVPPIISGIQVKSEKIARLGLARDASFIIEEIRSYRQQAGEAGDRVNLLRNTDIKKAVSKAREKFRGSNRDLETDVRGRMLDYLEENLEKFKGEKSGLYQMPEGLVQIMSSQNTPVKIGDRVFMPDGIYGLTFSQEEGFKYVTLKSVLRIFDKGERAGEWVEVETEGEKQIGFTQRFKTVSANGLTLIAYEQQQMEEYGTDKGVLLVIMRDGDKEVYLKTISTKSSYNTNPQVTTDGERMFITYLDKFNERGALTISGAGGGLEKLDTKLPSPREILGDQKERYTFFSLSPISVLPLAGGRGYKMFFVAARGHAQEAVFCSVDVDKKSGSYSNFRESLLPGRIAGEGIKNIAVKTIPDDKSSEQKPPEKEDPEEQEYLVLLHGGSTIFDRETIYTGVYNRGRLSTLALEKVNSDPSRSSISYAGFTSHNTLQLVEHTDFRGVNPGRSVFRIYNPSTKVL